MKQLFLYWRITPTEDFPKIIVEHGGRLEQMWRETDSDFTIEEERLGFISYTKICRNLEFAAKELNDPYIGLRLALEHSEDFHSMGPAVFILKNSKTIREFVNIGLQYQHLHTNGFSLTVEEDEAAQEATLSCVFHPLLGPYHQALEHTFAMLSVFGHKFLEKTYLKRVTFQHRAPDDMTWYETLFPDAEIEFNAPHNTMVTDIKILGIGRNSYISRALEKAADYYLKRQIKRHPYAKKSMAATVMEMMPALVAYQKSSIGHAAAILNIHPKKLQRLLKDEGASYSNILDRVRKAQATSLLEDTDIPIHQIAKILDYSSSQAFILAFRRWTDMTPRKYRSASKV